MPVPEIIHQLVERFEENRAAYRSGKYNETQLRLEFLDPFFEALGWDMYNKKGYAPDYRDVIHEDSIEIENVAKAPDYAFKIGKERKFFVEAKKPAVNIEFDIHPAYQLRRYAWNVRLPLSILTDFEEFAVYDCRNKPDHRDSAAAGRVLFFTYRQYLEKWDEIAAIFSRQSVLKGSFDQYAAGVKGKKGTLEVDDAFLSEIERWRDLLARNLALRNPAIANEHQLNYAVQMTIDRIIFLRICEDRGIEPEDQLRLAARTPAVYAELVRLFKRADMKYNSGLFHFSDESGQVSAADTFTPCLKIDDKVLKDILTSLYFPCPYIFKEIPVEILGQVYERFLGKVIRLTAGHQAKVEEKPEVRKAGGVYYTPTYIVSYIVQNTVGKLLEGITPDQASNLKLLDPACGSGSFLLGAYQYLLDWHLSWYSGHEPEKWARGKRPAVWQAQGDDWRLTTAEKKRILLNNIFGVDIDPQAVEVTKLSLLLKVLEGETGQLSLGLERVLPDLGQNIQCGNSLIGPDYYEGRQLSLGLLDEQERYRVNAFNWQAAFPQVFIADGFNAIIGNPPYIRSQSLGSDQRDYYNRVYKTATGTYDIYVLFVEKSISLIRTHGKCGFIMPNKFFTTDYGDGLRKLLAGNKLIEKIVDFEDAQVFNGAGTYTNLLFLSNSLIQTGQYTKLGDVFKESGSAGLAEALNNSDITFYPIELTKDGSRWTLASGESGSIIIRIQQTYPSFLKFEPHIFQGLKTSADKIYLLSLITKNDIHCIVENMLSERFTIEDEILRPVVKGENVQRYCTDTSKNLYIIYPYKIDENGKATIFTEIEMQSRFPKAWEYLIHHRKTLGARDNGIWSKRSDWYAYARSQNIGTFLGLKFLVPYMTTRLRADMDSTGTLFFVNITTGGYGLRINAKENSNFILGLLNSKLLDHCIKQMTNRFHGGYFAINKQALERLPYRSINFTDPADKSRHDRMVSLVERMLALHKQTARTPQEQEMLQREIAATDAQIDRLVYELYGLTEDEIRIVEGK
jgi:type I restriction-modification system DNA methylase subunit